MSTIINNAFKFDKNYNFQEVKSLFENLQEKTHRRVEEEYIRTASTSSIIKYDIETLKGEKDIDFCAICHNNYKNFYDMLFEPNSPINSLYELVIIPHKNDLYMLAYVDNQCLKELEECSFLKDYHYQNQSDKPDDISDTEWEEREIVWDEILDPYWIPAKVGFKLQLVFPYQINPFYSPKGFTESILNLDNRAKILAKDELADIKIRPYHENYSKKLEEKINEIKPKLKVIENIEELFKTGEI